MSLTFIDTNKLGRVASADGVMSSEVLSERLCGAKNAVGALHWIEAGHSLKVAASDKHQLIYLMEGTGVIRLDGRDYDVQKGAGVYLRPGESADISAKGSGLKLFHLEVRHVPPN